MWIACRPRGHESTRWRGRGESLGKNADLVVIFALGGERKSMFPRPAMPLRYIICTLIMKIISELFIILNGRM